MMRLNRPRKATILSMTCMILVSLIFGISVTQAQFRTHNLGDFKMQHFQSEGLNTNDDPPTGEWPQDVFRSSNFTFINHMRFVESWVDETGVSHSKEQFEGSSFGGQEPYVIQEYRRVAPPEVVVFAEGVEQVSSRRFNGEVDPTIPSDIMIVNRFKAAPGFDAVRRSYSFSNPNHDDYIIIESTYTFTGDHDDDADLDVDVAQGLQGVFFVIGYNMQNAAGTWISYSRWYEEGKDDWVNYESYAPQLVPGARDLAISYQWDGNYLDVTEFETGNPGPNGEFDDTGDPRWAIGSGGTTPLPSGEFISAAYAGFAVLHADQSPVDKSDDIAQPLSIIGNISIYNLWDNDFPGHGTPYDWAASGTRQTVDQEAGWPDDPNNVEGDYPFHAVGPYNFALGDSVTIVHTIGVNGISRSVAIEKGLEWRAWYRGEAGATFDDAAKNALIATGKDSLFQTMDRALWAWTNRLNIPDPLPAPDLFVRSGPNRIELEWEDMSTVGDLDTGVPDLDHYRIYRKKGSFLVDTDDELNAEGTHLVWELIAEVPGTQTTYTDNDVVRGEAYHYSVTAVDDGSQNTTGLFPGQKLESSIYANRSELPAFAFEPGSATANDVLVVPNPFLAGAGDYNFAGARSNTILFVNLPPFCTLKIFTVTGDLITTIEHTSGSGDEDWDLTTESNQFVASGVYILQVQDAQNLEGQPVAGKIEKFVIVR